MVIPINWTEILSKHNLESPGYHETVEATRLFQLEKKALQEKQRKEKQSRPKRRKGVRG